MRRICLSLLAALGLALAGLAQTSAQTLTPAPGGISAPPSGAASGDLTGSYPGPTIAKIQGTSITGTSGSGNVVLSSNGSIAAPTIAGGSINNTNIGGLTPAPGAFTTLTASSLTFGGGVLSTYTAPTAWTPAITLGGNATTASAATGSYIQLGKLVIAWFDITLSSLNSQTGAMLITGLPFAATATVGGGVAINYVFNGASTLTQPLTAYVSTSSTTIVVDKLVTGTSTQLSNTDLQANTRFGGVATYYVP